MQKKQFYLTQILNEFEKRKYNNPAYSLRSFARDLKLDSSSLSAIFKGKRSIPANKIEFIARKLSKTESEYTKFIKSIHLHQLNLGKIKSPPELPKRDLISEDDFKNISCTNTYTLLSLIELDDFQYDLKWISNKTKLSPVTIKKKVKALLDAGIIIKHKDTLMRTKKRTTTSDGDVSKIIQKHHLDTLDLAKSKCQELGTDKRYFSTLTIPTDIDSIEEVKKLIMEFEDKLEAFLLTKKKKVVTKLSIQFYPATEP